MHIHTVIQRNYVTEANILRTDDTVQYASLLMSKWVHNEILKSILRIGCWAFYRCLYL